jgi:RNA polymerase sigma-70 factor (ECF subfamily)
MDEDSTLDATGAFLHARSTPFHATSEDSDATFDHLYREHAPRVMAWAARLGGPGVDVDDVTQEVFLVVHRRLDTLRPDVKPTTWLFGITANVVKAHRRKLHVSRWVARLRPHELMQAVAPGPSPLETLEQRQAGELIYDVLNTLSEKQRQVFVLFELEGLSTEQVAEVTDTTLVASRVRLFRARTAFFRQLGRITKRRVA